jgi:membrane-bound serine protease (ClpP class)
MRKARTLRATFCAVLLLVGLAMACSDDAPDGAVHRMRLDGSIGPITERYIDRGIDRAEDNNAKLAVIELDTPGGLDSSMREIVQRIESSDVPVAVYVSPTVLSRERRHLHHHGRAHRRHGRTSIGSLAINADGSSIEGTWPESKTTPSRSSGALPSCAAGTLTGPRMHPRRRRPNTEAVGRCCRFHRQRLRPLWHSPRPDGRAPSRVTAELMVAGGGVVNTEFTALECVLEFIAPRSPRCSSRSFLGLIFEMATRTHHPGSRRRGDAVVLPVRFAPVDTAGWCSSRSDSPSSRRAGDPWGVVGGIGILALAIGAIIAFRDTPADLRPSYFLFALLAFVFVGMFVTIAMGINRVRKSSAAIGTAALVGKLATVRSPLTPEGYVFVSGERWRAQIDDGAADTGDKVRIIGADGFRLRVHKEDSP